MESPKKTALEATYEYQQKLREQKEARNVEFRDEIRDDALFVSDTYDELIEKTNEIFFEAMMNTNIFPTEIKTPYRRRIRFNGIDSIKLSKKIELINKYILEYHG